MAIRRKRSHKPWRVQKEDPHRINEKIIGIEEVRLVGDNVKMGCCPLRVALRIAAEKGLDLVEISPKAAPPVCKVMDYKKFLYHKEKREKELKAKAVKIVLKEVRFGPQTDDHDYEFKKKHAISFLSKGFKLKAFVFFRGRSIIHKDHGHILLLRLAQDLEPYGKVEQMPKLEGKKMIMLMDPIKKNKKNQ